MVKSDFIKRHSGLTFKHFQVKVELSQTTENYFYNFRKNRFSEKNITFFFKFTYFLLKRIENNGLRLIFEIVEIFRKITKNFLKKI